MIEEKDFKQTFGTRTPFKVPEGYFEALQKEVMAKLPEQQHAKIVVMKPKRSIFRPIAGIAASVCFLMGGFAIYSKIYNDEKPVMATTANNTQAQIPVLENNDYEAEDYIMMDNEAMYSYMMEQ